MAVNNVDWLSLLSSTSILPPDFSFRIISEDGEEVFVKAHRMVLSLMSPVFRAYLSEGGSWHNAHGQVIIKDVASKPFKTMINFLYDKDFDMSKEYENAEDLFEILKVADRFQIESLETKCKEILLNFPIEFKLLVNLVNTVNHYKTLAPFVDISQKIHDRAVDFLATHLKTTADVLRFMAQSDTDDPILEDAIKVELLKTMATLKCKTCGVIMSNDHCNKPIANVTHKNMVVGDRVEVTERSRFQYDCPRKLEVGHQGTIIARNNSSYTIWWDGEETLSYELCKSLHVPMRIIRK